VDRQRTKHLTTMTAEIRIAGSNDVVNTLLRTHLTKWQEWILCVEEWENPRLWGSCNGSESNLLAFYMHLSVWNENMGYDDADRWDIEESHPLYEKVGVIDRDDYWLRTGTSTPTVAQLMECIKHDLGPDGWLIAYPPKHSADTLPSQPDDGIREHIQTVRLSWSDVDALHCAAREQGITVSELIRGALKSVRQTA